jgi:hypothetical protein
MSCADDNVLMADSTRRGWSIGSRFRLQLDLLPTPMPEIRVHSNKTT